MMNIKHQRQDSQASCSEVCPPLDLLLRFTERKLHHRGAQEVRSHLAHCNSCAELTGLMEVGTPGQSADLDSPLRNEDRDMISHQLGFKPSPKLFDRLLALADSLWQIRTPILVPVSITALLLFVLLPSQPTARKSSPLPLVQQFSEIQYLVSTDVNLRSASGAREDYQAVAGSLIFLKHHSMETKLVAGTPVSVKINDQMSRRALLKTNVSENGLIELPLVITRPGHYQIRLYTAGSEPPLANLSCRILPPSGTNHD